MTPDELDRQTQHQLDTLHREFDNRVVPWRVERLGREHYLALRREATIVDFIPLLVYRFTREELVRATRDDLHGAA